MLSEVLRRLEVDNDTARRKALGILVLTKPVGIDGTMKYDIHTDGFENHPDESVTKISDNQHNYRIDPKLPDPYSHEKNLKLDKKKEEYRQSQQKLLRFYSMSDQITGKDWLRHQLFAARITKLGPDDLENAMRHTKWSQIPPNQLIEYFEREQHAA